MSDLQSIEVIQKSDEDSRVPVKRLKRSQAFVGLHFDFHADESCPEVGKTVTLDMLRDMLKRTKPDYVQCDCKGHPGYASYPTKVGTPVPGLIGDPLKLWRQATEEMGVSLYMHYSGVVDQQAVKDHPDWACLDAEGQPYKLGSTCVFGPYVDQLMIPMLRELAEQYHVDGMWLDGECWGLEMDYSTDAQKAWEQFTGKTQVPLKPTDHDWRNYQAFLREGFRKYVAHYVSVMHQAYPGFEIASNWAFSGHMPEKAMLDVDFVSGDIPSQNGYNRACLEARIMQGQPKPWDLMAWSFTERPGRLDRNTKSAVQLCQEAAAILAMGGGFQVYFLQMRDGSIAQWQMDVAEKVIVFCRERKKYCHRAIPVAQIGLILSSESYYHRTDTLLRPANGFYTPMEGHLRNLLDNQHAVQVPMEWELEEDIERYPVLVFAEWEYISEAFKQRLIKYVHDGGNLLVIGPHKTSNVGYLDGHGNSVKHDDLEPTGWGVFFQPWEN